MSEEESQDQSSGSENNQMRCAIGIDDLFWGSGDSEEEAIEDAREKIKELDVDDLDLTVVDRVDEGV